MAASGSEDVAATMHARVPFTACPLCDSVDIGFLCEASCMGHPMFTPALPATMSWLLCSACGHVFTAGYFTTETLDFIFSKSHDGQVLVQDQAEHARYLSARMVRLVAQLLGCMGGAWLDVGCGNGSLVTTAAEFGFNALGIDSRQEPVSVLTELGYQAMCVDFERLDMPLESFHVVSMCDVLEHMPFPRVALAKARSLLVPGGALFLSMPNRDCLVWRLMDRSGTNPYWGELEHYHNFDRAGLTALLQQFGFTTVYYGVSERYRAAMEIVAIKAVAAGEAGEAAAAVAGASPLPDPPPSPKEDGATA